jgi:L-aspartate oxidase
MPRPLLSEALRGHGALLRDANGEQFVDELLPRDKVSRAMTARMLDQNVDHLWLDATKLERFDERFPTIAAALNEVGLDPARDWLPIAPAAHYLCGGVVADLDGASSLPGLWAAGEAACNGVHGANRLASNSLLDGLVFGERVVEGIVAGKTGADSTGAMRGVLDVALGAEPASDPVVLPQSPGTDPAELRGAVQRTMSADCGVVRDAVGLQSAAETLGDLALLTENLPARTVPTYEVLDLVRVSRAIVASARAREESRGSHTRRDFRSTTDDFFGRFVVRGGESPAFVPLAELAVRERR